MSSSIRAEKLRIKGTVQGVGFRPFVFVLAKNEGLTGTVLNDGRGVEAVLEGSSEALERFRTRLLKELPRSPPSNRLKLKIFLSKDVRTS